MRTLILVFLLACIVFAQIPQNIKIRSYDEGFKTNACERCNSDCAKRFSPWRCKLICQATVCHESEQLKAEADGFFSILDDNNSLSDSKAACSDCRSKCKTVKEKPICFAKCASSVCRLFDNNILQE